MMRKALPLKARSGQGQNTTSTLITPPLTKNSQLLKLTQRLAGRHLTANKVIIKCLYQKSRQQQLLIGTGYLTEVHLEKLMTRYMFKLETVRKIQMMKMMTASQQRYCVRLLNM